MRYQIITKDNGWGLSHDIRVLRAALQELRPGCEVDFCEWRQPKQKPARHYDVNFYLEEILDHRFSVQARLNVLIPNPEWFAAVQNLRYIDQVWAKTHDCEEIFGARHKDVRYLGWTSEDRLLSEAVKAHGLIHIAGDSNAKGTLAVIDAMRIASNHAMTLVSRKDWGSLPSNVVQFKGMGNLELQFNQNVTMVHLCPSSYEGFGHYINEARSVGAVIITTNAAPMNELVTKDIGFGAAVASTSRQNLATHHHVDPGALADCIDAAMSTPIETLRYIGTRARAAYLAGRDEFKSNLRSLLP
jgi:hypothetical protein